MESRTRRRRATHAGAKRRRVNSRKASDPSGSDLGGRRTAHWKRSLNQQEPAGSPLIRWRFRRHRATRLRLRPNEKSETGEEPGGNRDPRRVGKRRRRRLRKLCGGNRAPVMMVMAFIAGRGHPMMMVMRTADCCGEVRDPLTAMLRRHMRAGGEPGEQHDCRDEGAGKLHDRISHPISMHRQGAAANESARKGFEYPQTYRNKWQRPRAAFQAKTE